MTPDLSDYERATVDRIEAAEAAPESFDAVAALRRVEELADEIDAITGARWSPDLYDVHVRLRRALDGPA